MPRPFRRPPASDVTPEQREARIAELRARRRARMKVLARRSAFTSFGLLLLVAVVLWWLLGTLGGRDFLLDQIVARLPANATFSWQRVEGEVSGPLTLHDVHFSMPSLRPECTPTPADDCVSGQIVFDAARIMLDPAIRPLIGRTLRLDALQVDNATLQLPASQGPFKLPSWPEILPGIALPMALQAGDMRVNNFKVLAEDAASGQYPLLIDIEQLRGGLRASQGELHVEHLRVDSSRGRFSVHGDYVPAEQFRTDLIATAVLPAAPDREPARLGLVARGNLDAMTLALAGTAPGPLHVTVQLDGGANTSAPRWQLRANAEALDPGLLTATTATAASTPPAANSLSLQLAADGNGGRIDLRGELVRGDFSARIAPSQLRIENQVLEVQPLVLEMLDGRIVARGHADFTAPENASFRWAISARDLAWGGATTHQASATPAAAAAPTITADATLGIAGTLQQWAAIGHAALARAGEQATVEFDTRGDTGGLVIQSLQARMPTGTLDASGQAAWAPTPGWNIDATLAGFDPGYFASGWNGAVNGRLHSTGNTGDNGALDVAVELEDLGGRLRGRPLDGHGRFAMHGADNAGGQARYEGEVALSLGGSRIKAQGHVGNTLDIDASVAPLRLADLLPDASGTLRGDVQLTGTPAAPDIAANLQGNALKYGAYAADSLALQGRLPWSQGSGQLRVRASGLQAGVALDSVAIDARGAVESLQLDARASGEVGTLALSGNLDKSGAAWTGAVESLQLAPARGAQWQLQQPAQFRWNAGNVALSQSCLASNAGGTLCIGADWPGQGITIAGQDLPLALASAYLPERGDGGQWQLRGEVAVDAQLRPEGNGWRGFANVTSDSGGLKFNAAAQQALFRYRDFALRSTFRPTGIEADLHATLNDDGRLQARLSTGWNANAPLAGALTLDTDELTWVELLSPDIVKPEGRLSADIRLAGTRDAPRIAGQAQLRDFTTGIPSLAITLRDGNVQLLAQPDGSARISGSVRSAPSDQGGRIGVLDIDGTLGWQGEAPLLLHVNGERVLVADTPDLHAVISPDVEVRVAAGEPTEVTGTVVVNEARIDLERLEGGVSPSPDVVVLDPADPDSVGTASGLLLDLTLALGDDVDLNGFGLQASLDGRMRVRARPGHEMIANGQLNADGYYQAYGQELDITRGQLIWTSGPVADPILDIRAQREVGDVTAGVNISGRVSRPEIEVWSDPASSQSQALAYLTLGRPLSSLTGAERGQLDAANAALTAGGSLLAGKLGASLGLDDAGMMDSRALGGSVLGVGKQLSPRLYVGYGVSLLGTGQVLILKYLLDHGFDIEIESSTIENRALLNWRIER